MSAGVVPPISRWARQALVFGQGKFRRGFHGGDKMERLAAGELDFLDVRREHRGDFLLRAPRRG